MYPGREREIEDNHERIRDEAFQKMEDVCGDAVRTRCFAGIEDRNDIVNFILVTIIDGDSGGIGIR